MKKYISALLAVGALICGLSSNEASANRRHMKNMPEPTQQQKINIATLHEQLGACLRTDKSMRDCHKEMKNFCEKMGKEACPMMHAKHDAKDPTDPGY